VCVGGEGVYTGGGVLPKYLKGFIVSAVNSVSGQPRGPNR
jgi:hypothetical protein